MVFNPRGEKKTPHRITGENAMWKLLVMWVMLAACIFCAVNFFLIPQFPIVAQNLHGGLTLWGSVGSSALVMIAGMLFGGK